MPSQDSSHPAPCRLLRPTDSTSTPHESGRAWLVILRLTDPRYGRGILGYGPGAHQALRQECHSCEPWDELEGDQKDPVSSSMSWVKPFSKSAIANRTKVRCGDDHGPGGLNA